MSSKLVLDFTTLSHITRPSKHHHNRRQFTDSLECIFSYFRPFLMRYRPCFFSYPSLRLIIKRPEDCHCRMQQDVYVSVCYDFKRSKRKKLKITVAFPSSHPGVAIKEIMKSEFLLGFTTLLYVTHLQTSSQL